MDRNKQLDEDTGRNTWKCRDPLNCVALAVFLKHGTWVQTWTWHFRGTSTDSAIVRLAFGPGLDRYGSYYSSPHGYYIRIFDICIFE